MMFYKNRQINEAEPINEAEEILVCLRIYYR